MRLGLTVFALFVLSLLLLKPRRLNRDVLPNADVWVKVDEQRASHILFRKNLVAAHLNIFSGATGRILTAFPAGNSGVAIWLTSPAGVVNLSWDQDPRAVPGGTQAVTFDVAAAQDELVVTQAVLGGVRSIREWDIDRIKPNEIQEQTEFKGGHTVTFHRPGIDRTMKYSLTVTVLDGTARRLGDGRVAFASRVAGAGLRLRVTSETSERALTPIPPDHLLKPEVIIATEARSVQLLSFLMYREKFLAGSWTFLTYFGRDTLLTLRFLIHALQPDAVESMLGAVIDRVREDGDVAHEEEIGDYAALKNLRRGLGRTSKPFYDYRMIDDDFLLVPVLETYLRDADPERARDFLNRRTPDGRTYVDAIASNIALIERKATPFANDPTFRHLIAFPTGQLDGNWRDSQSGVGFGRYVYDVNVALVPAALKAARALVLSPYFGTKNNARAAQLLRAIQTWESSAPQFFHVEVPLKSAIERAERYAREQSLLAPKAPETSVAFSGISLDDNGRVIPVMNSDVGFLMMFGDPPDATLQEIAAMIEAPFPYGLSSDVGLLVVNPAFADEKMRLNFSARHYHGTVVWSWQQAMMAAALRRQIERGDIAVATRAKLEAAEAHVWELITRSVKYRTSELWTWRPERGTMSYIPFGQNAGDHAEGNPNQGWSHAFIGVRPPAHLNRVRPIEH